ncbi:TonB-dependent receptor [Niabella aquatica]
MAKAQRDSIYHYDSIRHIQLENIIVIAQQHSGNKKVKVLSTLDGYLENDNTINMIKRGAYAWEPLLNGMATERSVITVDGMRIFGACTDKMDPVTSYVEITNLSKADIHSGQSGAANGATIAGSINLARKTAGFSDRGFNGSAFTGLETANMQKIAGTSLQYASRRFFTDFDFTYRDANNYKAGGGKEILYSQFTKYNVSANAGIQMNDHQQLSASVIYDRAMNVGYPALPMDVSLARAFIGSVAYKHHHLSPFIENWETKLYYNAVTHIMDDSKRPVVPIRMDMPGWARTGGFYSKLSGAGGKHNWLANLSGYYNTSLAEMTMFSNNPAEKDMFMLTWPDVHSLYSGIFIEDHITINNNWSTAFTLGSGINNNIVKDEQGFESLKIFYPQMQKSNTRLLNNISAKVNYRQQQWKLGAGLGYGERAPAVSEGYGYYLFNSFDRFDYIGNPGMQKERSLELNAVSSFTSKNFSIEAQANLFRISGYIIGKPNPDLSPMTIGANGVKVYEQLPQAMVFNASVSAVYQFMKALSLSGKTVYRSGRSGALRLPLIQPLSYGTTLQYQRHQFMAEASMEGALAQTRYSATFGETPAKAYTVFNISASQQLNFNNHKLTIKAGVENLLDKYYSTFADWNRIPRMGRNVFINVLYGF